MELHSIWLELNHTTVLARCIAEIKFWWSNWRSRLISPKIEGFGHPALACMIALAAKIILDDERFWSFMHMVVWCLHAGSNLGFETAITCVPVSARRELRWPFSSCRTMPDPPVPASSTNATSMFNLFQHDVGVTHRTGGHPLVKLDSSTPSSVHCNCVVMHHSAWLDVALTWFLRERRSWFCSRTSERPQTWGLVQWAISEQASPNNQQAGAVSVSFCSLHYLKISIKFYFNLSFSWIFLFFSISF